MSSGKTSCWTTSVADTRHALRQGLRALFALSLLWLAACSQPPAPLVTLQGPTMGTSWSVKLAGLPAGVSREQLQDDIELLLESINRQMSTYQEDSEISRFNRQPAGSWQALAPDFARVMRYSLALAADSGGAFDPTIGPVVNLWGFGPDTPRHQRPDEAALAAARARVGWQRLQWREADSALYQPGDAYVDLSAVAKGYAVDRVVTLLAGLGVQSMLVEIGGELRATGRKPDGQPWRVGIERPVPGVREVARVVMLEDAAMATSGDYRNFFQQGDTRYAHIIDPRTGEPVSHRVVSVTVVHPEAMEADALATALTVMGATDGLAWAEARNLAVLFMVQNGDTVEERLTSAMSRYLAEEVQHD